MSAGETFSLRSTPAGLGLVWHEQEQMKPLVIDFLAGRQAHRAQQATTRDEAIGRACGLVKHPHSSIIDATAGLGRDAWVLVNLGATVTMLERQPEVYALLQDALARLYAQQPEYRERFFLADYASLNEAATGSADVVYLDPMYPKGDRKQKAAVKKDMQMFQQLVGSDSDADQLLAPARRVARRRVVVKRPQHAAFLAQTKPDLQVVSKKHRFDVYLNPTPPNDALAAGTSS
ncbi:class I SAM-dependent methyltransferase [Pseudidiomarina terrestris]|uniref:Ribosomal RNA small subunit methyltransferase J n=1 Tax=Pseudidiomarina terrestris TaxID=2820060 RepID=A0AAW7R0X5_9GAMM|nr:MULTISPECIES: class I SAM-dependent methyltransferase [unclassified Pseudidiomarina]MDN7124785.1 class I SAM-dependent methyltransferase [Pseudidiomarina sp. 1APP75-32.1]MDN7129741.1 class I SAM-dependent methyltransferase [Pseudidiomarina sp. 1APR75-15]MDN7136474.1 class I SAM-dependent methyltransferase [Pseudidiomarina sp. 1ASP75-5]MEA3588228.1 class I SAM-dependent methyltransferase [Pseudidiomarina sp. 1APP75-27a]